MIYVIVYFSCKKKEKLILIFLYFFQELIVNTPNLFINRKLDNFDFYLQHIYYNYIYTYNVWVNITIFLFDIIYFTEFLIDHRSTIDQMTLVQEATILALGAG